MIEIDYIEFIKSSCGYPSWFRTNTYEGHFMRQQLYAQMMGWV